MRDKQIEEMQNDLIAISKSPIMIDGLEHWSDAIAEELYNAGYRKASDVALEVIREVIGIFRISDSKKHIDLRSETERWSFDKEKFRKGIAELKKKYESEGEG